MCTALPYEYNWIYISGQICKKIELSSSNSSYQEKLKITGQYEVRSSSALTQKQKPTIYYNAERNTYLLLSREGVWMVGYILPTYVSV